VTKTARSDTNVPAVDKANFGCDEFFKEATSNKYKMCLKCTDSTDTIVKYATSTGENKFNIAADKVVDMYCEAYSASADGTATDVTKKCSEYIYDGTSKNFCNKCREDDDMLVLTTTGTNGVYAYVDANVTKSFCKDSTAAVGTATTAD